MNFGLTREQELVRQMVREFAVNEVKPIAAEIDETERFPMENVKKMAELGMMGIPFPKELGGAGGDVLSYIITVEELSKVCGTTGLLFQLILHFVLLYYMKMEHSTKKILKFHLQRKMEVHLV